MCIKPSENKMIKALENPPPQYCVNAILFEGRHHLDHLTSDFYFPFYVLNYFPLLAHVLFLAFRLQEKGEFMIKALDKG